MKDLLQISGAVVITVGALLIAIPAGLIVGGVFLVLIGISLER
jgi:ABC-type phosphate transport system permease subunit